MDEYDQNNSMNFQTAHCSDSQSGVREQLSVYVRKKLQEGGDLSGDSVVKGKRKGANRVKRRKASDSSKKTKKEEEREGGSANMSVASVTPDSDLRLEQPDSPITEDVFEGSNSSQESTELSMSSLLRNILNRKKQLLFESDEILQFFQEQCIKREDWDG